MLRREFLSGMSAMLLASQTSNTTGHKPPCVAVEDDPRPEIKRENYQDYAKFLEAKYPLPSLTPLISFRVTLTLSNSRIWGHWNDDQRACAFRAAALFQTVWSSEEFKKAVCSIPTLIWHGDTDDEAKYPANISGKALYPKLIASLDVNMPIRMISTPKDQTAASGLTSTDLEEKWAKKADVYDLCNTFSHEYTHYGVPGWSWDKGHEGSVKRYVSYGIGGLTENLAAGYTRCCDDPTT